MAAQQGGGQQSDNSMGIIWVVAGVCILFTAIWVAFKSEIITGLLSLKLMEIKFLAKYYPNYFLPIQSQIESAMMMSDKLTLIQVGQVAGEAGMVVRYPLTGIVIVFCFLIYFSNSTRHFKNTYNMKQLAKLEVKNWPQITPILKMDLLKENINKGAWAMALTPMQFCKKNNLIEEIEEDSRTLRRNKGAIKINLKMGQAAQLFAQQLGGLYPGVQRLPVYMRALFAVFAARINADTKAAQDLLMQMSRTANQNMDFSGADQLLEKHLKSKLVQEILQRHAYTYTVMASLLEGARADGVQASADFLWLKPLDRRLWYVLNTVGRQTPFAEVAGVFAHWVSEKQAGAKLVVPVIEEAVKALDIAVHEVLYKADERN